MKKGTRTALLIVLGACALVVATCGGAAAWLFANSDRLTEQGKAAMHDGARFGGGQQAPTCVEEALRRLEQADLGILGEATNKVFLEACLDVPKLPPGFCEGVPPRDQIIKSATWAMSRCAQAGRANSQPCTRLVGAIQEKCLEQ